MKKYFLGFFFVISFLSSPLHPVQLSERPQQPFEFASLFRCILHAPEVLMFDSENTTVIKITSLLAAFGTASKLSYELFKNREKTTAAGLLLYPLPKIGLYSLSEIYDMIRFIDAEYVAEKNSLLNQDNKLRNLKISQFMQLMAELAIRVCSFGAASIYHNGGDLLAIYLFEIADVVELWRLLSRWWTILRFKVKVDMSIETSDTKDESVDPEVAPHF